MIAQDASGALSSVTGQEIVQVRDRGPETSTVEPASPPATYTAPTRQEQAQPGNATPPPQS